MRNYLLGDKFVRLASHANVHVAEQTSEADVLALIRALRPVDDGKDLIRLGPPADGGYLLPDDLAGIEYAFSPGVADQSGFEAALAERGMRVFLADHSVDGPAQQNPRFDFEKKFVGCLSDDQFMTLDAWKQLKIPGHTGDLLLQMDIEGAEFETLLATSAQLLAQFRVMVIEFHHLQHLWNRPYFELASRLFQKLLTTHAVVHLHPNNCCGSVTKSGIEIPRFMEITLHRRDRLTVRGFRTRFPHPLDADCTGRGPLRLAAGWYGP